MQIIIIKIVITSLIIINNDDNNENLNNNDDNLDDNNNDEKNNENENVNNINNINRWNITKIDFFDSHYDEKITTIIFIVKYVDKDTYFKNMHIFLKRVRNIIIIKKIEIIKFNLYIYFRETTLKWYISILIKK